MKRPADLYTAATRCYDGLPDLTYPFHDRDVIITTCGRLCLHRKRINISTVLAGQKLGIKEVDEGIGSSASCTMISYISTGAEDLATTRQPVRHEVVTHVLGTFRYPCIRAGHAAEWWAPAGLEPMEAGSATLSVDRQSKSGVNFRRTRRRCFSVWLRR
jgi:hypothetical protein